MAYALEMNRSSIKLRRPMKRTSPRLKLAVAFTIPTLLLYAVYSYARTAKTRERFALLICPGGGPPYIALTVSAHPNSYLAQRVSASRRIDDEAELARVRHWFAQATRYTPNHDADLKYSVCQVETAGGESCSFLLIENSKKDYFMQLRSSVDEGWNLGMYRLPAGFQPGF